jgi:hypothetical protein
VTHIEILNSSTSKGGKNKILIAGWEYLLVDSIIAEGRRQMNDVNDLN